jgi:hypothetical protein
VVDLAASAFAEVESIATEVKAGTDSVLGKLLGETRAALSA